MHTAPDDEEARAQEAGAHRARVRRFRVVAAAILVVMGLGLFWGALFRGETFAHRDLGAFYRPAKALVVPLARASGGVPQWNPLFASGQPFAANPEHEIFHPMTALLFLLPFEWAFRCQVMLPPFFALASMFALLRTLRRSRGAALFGGLAWGFGGYLLSTTNLLPILFAVAALPLVLLFAVRVARQSRSADLAGLGVSFALVCLAGEPSTLLATPLLVAAALSATRGGSIARRFLPAAAGLVLGAALAGATLVPGLHHASKTRRAAGLDAETVNQWSMPPVRVAELFAPHLLGHVDERDASRYWGRAFYPGREFPFLYSLYPGLFAALLAIAAWTVRRRAVAPWLVTAGAGCLVAVGNHLPLWGWLRHLPLVSGIRFPEKFALLIALPVVVAAAHGFDQIARGSPRSRRGMMRALTGVGLCGLAVAGALFAIRLGGKHHPPFPLALAGRDALRLALVAAVGVWLLHLRARWPREPWALLVCAAAALDLGTAGKELVPSVPIAKVATPPAFLAPVINAKKEPLLFHLAAWDPKLNEAPGLAKPPIPAQWGVATTLETDFDLTQLDWSLRATELFWSAMERDPELLGALLRRRGVTAVLKFRKGVTRQGGRLSLPAGATSPLEVLTAEDAQPFAFSASRVALVHGGQGWVDNAVKLGDQLAGTASLDASEGADIGLTPAPATITVVARTPVDCALDVVAQGPGGSFVAINQSWDRGWHAQIDGKPARLVRTDVSLSGLQVPAGRHRVELTYDDPWLQAGLWLSGAGALVALALVAAGRRRPRQSTT